MKKALEFASVCALIAIAFFFIVLSLGVTSVSRELVGTLAAVHKTADAGTAAAADLHPAIVDLRRTILVAGGTLNLARQTMRNEQTTIREGNAQTIATMKNVDELVAGVDKSQREITEHADKALASIETIETTIEPVLASVPPVLAQTREDIAALEPVIAAAKPVLDNTAATMANADRISADLATFTDNAVKPKPWYKRAAGYVWAPVKLAAIFAK